MEADEIDIALDELENRLDRLRALYEQYFLGIEKIEPAVARKDVDRRFWVLRRTQIRNTARRFRLQVLVQRYNTFQQYWGRICREIENGTYHRHLLKAQKKFGAEPLTWAAGKRPGGTTSPHSDLEQAPDSGEGLRAMLQSGTDLSAEAVRVAAEALAAAEERGRAAEASAPPGAAPHPVGRKREDLGRLDLDFDEEPAPLRKPAPRVAPPPAARAQPQPSGAPAPARPSAPLPGSPATAPGAPPGAEPRPAAAAAPSAAGAGAVSAASPAQGSPAAIPKPRLPMPAARPAAPGGGISDARVRELHAELLAARRNLKQGDGVSLDSLARTLRDAEQKLRTQHQGGTIDFQVSIRDGKPVVKPVIRK